MLVEGGERSEDWRAAVEEDEVMVATEAVHSSLAEAAVSSQVPLVAEVRGEPKRNPRRPAR